MGPQEILAIVVLPLALVFGVLFGREWWTRQTYRRAERRKVRELRDFDRNVKDR